MTPAQSRAAWALPAAGFMVVAVFRAPLWAAAAVAWLTWVLVVLTIIIEDAIRAAAPATREETTNGR